MNAPNMHLDRAEQQAGGSLAYRIPLALFLFCTSLLLQGCPEGTLTVVKLGNGQGEVRTKDFQFECPASSPTCSPKKVSGEPTLAASPAPGSVFGQWFWQNRSIADEEFKLKMDGNQTVYAAFCAGQLPSTAKLTYTQTGSGVIGAFPRSNRSCGPGCGEYAGGTIVTLGADQAGGLRFEGWDGCPHPEGTTCVVAMCQDMAVTARFGEVIPDYRLSVRDTTSGDTGAGRVLSGVVTGLNDEINCGGRPRGNRCSQVYRRGTKIRLTAVPEDDSTFAGWTEGCAGTNPVCELTMDGNKTVRASFNGLFRLTVVRQTSSSTRLGVTVTGDGAVNARLPGVIENLIDCGRGCNSQSHDFRAGDRIAINAIPAPGSTVSFSGGCTINNLNPNTCYITMLRQDVTITVTFGVP